MGILKPHHRFLLSEHLALIDTLEEAIERVSREIEQRLNLAPVEPEGGTPQPEQEQTSQGTSSDPGLVEAAHERPAQELSWKQAVDLLDTIPGINARAAQGILAEIGIQMDRFPSAHHLASWAGMCPGNRESAGKRLSGKTRKGSPWLRKLLVEAAHAAAHTKNTYLSALYRRLATRGGPKKAMIAVGHAMLIICYHLLDQQIGYEELGGNYFDERERQAVEKRLVRRLEKLGYQVELHQASQVA